jgi:hypothetical protein
MNEPLKNSLGGAAGFATAAIAPAAIKAGLAIGVVFAIYIVSKRTESEIEGRLGLVAGFLAFASSTPISERFLSQSEWIINYFYLFIASVLGVIAVRLFSSWGDHTDDLSEDEGFIGD